MGNDHDRGYASVSFRPKRVRQVLNGDHSTKNDLWLAECVGLQYNAAHFRVVVNWNGRDCS